MSELDIAVLSVSIFAIGFIIGYFIRYDIDRREKLFIERMHVKFTESETVHEWNSRDGFVDLKHSRIYATQEQVEDAEPFANMMNDYVKNEIDKL